MLPAGGCNGYPSISTDIRTSFFHMIWPEMEVIVSSNFRENHICSVYIYIYTYNIIYIYIHAYNIYIYIYNLYIYIYYIFNI